MMKYLRQFLVILAVTSLGELIRHFVPLPIPASIYGLVIMLVLLISGAVKLDQVEDAAEFLVAVMPVMFIPAAAGLIVSWASLKAVLLPVSVMTIAANILVFGASGKVTDLMIRKGGADKDE